MKNYKLLFLSILLIAGFTVLGCSNPSQDSSSGGSGSSNGNNPSSGSIVSLNTNNARNVCSSFITVSTGNSRAATNSQEIKSLTYFENGINKPFTFKTSSGKEVLLTVSEVKKITDTTVAIRFDASWEVTEIVPAKPGMKQDSISVTHQENRWGQALVNLKTGEYFDFSGYDFDNIKGNDKYIFAFSGQTLYKIDIKNKRKATPINVAEHDPLDSWGTSFYIIDDDKLYVKGGDSDDNIYFYNSKKPRCKMGSIHIIDDKIKLNNYKERIQYIQAPTGEIFALFQVLDENNNNKTAWGKINFNTSKGIIEISGIKILNNYISTYPWDDEYVFYAKNINNEFIQEYGNFYKTNDLLIIANSGKNNPNISKSKFIQIKVDSSGLNFITTESSEHYGITTICRQRDIDPIIVFSNKIYFMEGTSLKVIYYKNDNSSAIDLYSSPTLITEIKDSQSTRKFNLVNDTIIFYQYIDATTVGTYSIPITGLPAGQSPTLLSEYNAEVKDMIYLDF